MLRWLFVFCFVSTLSAFGQNIVYKHPMPDARFVSKQTSIIFKTTNPVKNPTPFRHLVVQGEKSGRHTGVFLFDEHEKTIVFKPTCHFVLGEKVFVSLDLGIGRDKRLDYTFYIAEDIQKCPDYQWQAQSQSRQKLSKESPGTVGNVTTINGVAVPSDFPIIDTNIYQETAPGRIFFSSTFTSLGNYLVICENDGTPYWYRRYDRINLGSGDFKVQPSGVLTAFLFVPSHYIALDKNYRQFATYKCGHGYRTDLHECVLLPNEHALLIGEDIQRRDVSKIVPGGNKSANVIGNHLQEVDKDGNVYFEWRSWDYFNIEDAVHENLSASVIDYVHMNSIAIDYDGHYVISSRHLSEVSKISKDTGEFIWRFGGVNNQFSLINDTIPISYQHHAIPIPGKANYYTIFDNGNHRNPDYSRAVEFKLDLASKTAEKVWEYRYTPDRKCRMMGSVQRLPNNNTFIDWSANPPLRACEVTPDGDIVFEIKVQESSPYRSQRFEWNGMMDVPYLIIEPHKTKLFLIFNKFGDPDVENY
ncbi:aryl-sulfate sulfotransferase, partial [candidate division KSB1 bacterium]|nr:aryl-sulfate sulfotransferase [candidate division KSB1 bacterium]